MDWMQGGARFWGCSHGRTDRRWEGAAILGMLCCVLRVVVCGCVFTCVWMDGGGEGGAAALTADMCNATQWMDGWMDQWIVLSMVCDAFTHTWIFLVSQCSAPHPPQGCVCETRQRARRRAPLLSAHAPTHRFRWDHGIPAIQPLPPLHPSIHQSLLVSLLSHGLFLGVGMGGYIGW